MFFGVMVVMGLGVELIAFGLSYVAANKEILELQAKLQPRTITEQQRTNFIALMSGYPKTHIKVFVGVEDYETDKFARRIRQMLNADWLW